MNKKVLITGGSRGIGAACVKRFAKEKCDVAFIYHANDKAANELIYSIKNETPDVSVYAVKADVSNSMEAEFAYKEAVKKLGRTDVLINCAGIASIKLITDVSDCEWHKMLDTNLSSAFYFSRSVAREMITRQYGRIINIGSVWGAIGASCEVPYSASKAGLRGLTQALAKELGPSNITVNCVEPGVIDTDMNASISKEEMAELKEMTPLCRIGKAEDIAAAVWFLSSDEASFITGAILPVGGGFPA